MSEADRKGSKAQGGPGSCQVFVSGKICAGLGRFVEKDQKPRGGAGSFQVCAASFFDQIDRPGYTSTSWDCGPDDKWAIAWTTLPVPMILGGPSWT